MFIMLTVEDAIAIRDDFIAYCKTDDLLRIYPSQKCKTLPDGTVTSAVWETFYVPRVDLGVKWKLIFCTPIPSNMNCMLEVRINPQILLHDDYVVISDESDLPATRETYDVFAKKISKKLPPFVAYKLNRVDYCLNACLSEMGYDCSVKQMLKLTKQAAILRHYKRPLVYDMTSKRMGFYRNGFRAESGSVVINNYGKQVELMENHPYRKDDIARAEHLIRHEIQCKSRKIAPLRTDIPGNFGALGGCNYDITEKLLSNEFAKSVIEDYFRRTIINGDYYTMDKAVKKIESFGFRSQKQSRLITALELVDFHGGIEAVKDNFKMVDDDSCNFINSVNELASLGINPVTTPRRVGCIPNLLTSYTKNLNRYNSMKI
jgi:hypothetical protein